MPTQAILDSANNVVVNNSPYHLVAMDGYDQAMSSVPFRFADNRWKEGQFTVDDGIAFYVSQLAGIDPKLYETKYRHIVYQELVPIDTNGPAYLDHFVYFSYDAATIGKFIGANGKDMPNVATKANKSVIKVEEGGIGYSYSLQELEKAAAMNMPLDANGAKACKRGKEEHAQRVAFFGDAELGVTGLLNNANVAVDNSSAAWSTLTQLQRYNDLNSLLIKVWEDSAHVHYPNRMILPTELAEYWTQPMSADRPEITLGKYFLENNWCATQGINVQVKFLGEMNDAGVGATRRMMAYEVTDENLVMKMPRDLEFLPPQPDGFNINVPGRYKFGGVEFRYPGCAAYRDGQ